MPRHYQITATDTPKSLTESGRGDIDDLLRVNAPWGLHGDGPGKLSPWNPGMTIVIPPSWAPIAGEFLK